MYFVQYTPLVVELRRALQQVGIEDMAEESQTVLREAIKTLSNQESEFVRPKILTYLRAQLVRFHVGTGIIQYFTITRLKSAATTDICGTGPCEGG